MGILRKTTTDTPETTEVTKSVVVVAPVSVQSTLAQKATHLIVRPIVSEKSARLATEGTYVFEVATSANRVEVGQAIFQMYGVRPTKVNILVQRGNQVRSGRRLGVQKRRKRALVTLPKGKKIDVYEGV